MMRIVVCDDERCYSDAVCDAVKNWQKIHNITSVTVAVFSSSEDLMEALDNGLPYDMAFLDIQFPGELSGLELAKRIREKNEHVSVALMTNYQEYAIDGYKVNAMRFLQKPIKAGDIYECLDIAYHQWKLISDRSLIIEAGQQCYRMAHRDIIYAESRAHYVIVHQVSRDSEVAIRLKLSEFNTMLPEEMFIQCHRSYTVNLLHVYSISKAFVIMSDGTQIPISPRQWQTVHQKFKAFYLGGSHGY